MDRKVRIRKRSARRSASHQVAFAYWRCPVCQRQMGTLQGAVAYCLPCHKAMVPEPSPAGRPR